MKAVIQATIPASIVSARAGLAAISTKILSPAGKDRFDMLFPLAMKTRHPLDFAIMQSVLSEICL